MKIIKRRVSVGATSLLAALILSACAGTPKKSDPVPTASNEAPAPEAGGGVETSPDDGGGVDGPLDGEDGGDDGEPGADLGDEDGPGEGDDKEVPERPKNGGLGEVKVSAAAESALDRAADQIDSGDLAGARQTLEGLLSDPKAAFLAQYNLGVLADREGRVEDARGAFLESLRLNGDFAPALVSLCRLYIRQGKPGLAVQAADRAIRNKPNNLDLVDARLQVLLHMRRYEEVIRDAKGVLKRDERNVKAMVNMATAYHMLGKHELAEDVLLQVEKVATVPVVLADVRYRLGFVYLAMKRDKAALSAFEKAVEVRPDFAEAYNNLGVLYHKARAFGAAVEQFQRALKVHPRYKEAQLNLGNAYKGMKNYEDAEKAFVAAMRIDASYGLAYFNLGILYLDASFDGRDKKEQYQLAIDNFNRYKSEMKSELPRDDPADRYIEEAKKKIELEIKREEMRREAAMESEEDFEDFEDGEDGGGEGDDGDFEDDGGGGDDGDFEDDGGDDGAVDDGGADDGGAVEDAGDGGDEDFDDGEEDDEDFDDDDR